MILSNIFCHTFHMFPQIKSLSLPALPAPCCYQLRPNSGPFDEFCQDIEILPSPCTGLTVLLLQILAIFLASQRKVELAEGDTINIKCKLLCSPKGPKWLEHLLRRCFGVVLRVKYLLRRCLDP